MGRAFEAIRTQDLAHLFVYFGIEANPALVEAHRNAITARFKFEVQEIVRLCSKLKEGERYKLFREALRLAYESTLIRASQAAS